VRAIRGGGRGLRQSLRRGPMGPRRGSSCLVRHTRRQSLREGGKRGCAGSSRRESNRVRGARNRPRCGRNGRRRLGMNLGPHVPPPLAVAPEPSRVVRDRAGENRSLFLFTYPLRGKNPRELCPRGLSKGQSFLFLSFARNVSVRSVVGDKLAEQKCDVTAIDNRRVYARRL